MKRLLFILFILATASIACKAQSTIFETRYDTTKVSKVYVEDSATGMIKLHSTKLLIMKLKITTVKMEDVNLPTFSEYVGLYDDKKRLIRPLIAIGMDGKLIPLQ